MRYKVRWIETSGYYTNIEADSEAEAIQKFESGEWCGAEPDYDVDIETDVESITAEPDNDNDKT